MTHDYHPPPWDASPEAPKLQHARRRGPAPRLEVPDALPPHDSEAERVLLGALLLDPAKLTAARGAIDGDAFFDLRHRSAWQALCTLADAGAPIDSGTLATKLRDLGDPDPPPFVSGLLDSTAGAATLPFYLERLRDCARRRLALRLAIELAEAARDPSTPIDTALAAAREACGWQTRASEYAVRSLGELVRPETGDPGELLRHRFLCRGGGLLLAAPTGIGKSTLAVQFALCWALGRESLGIVPARPLRSLYIQAENDDGDLAELRDGICEGMQFSDADRAQAFDRVHFASVDDLCGTEFIRRAFVPLVEVHRPDFVFLDPLLAYLGADVSKQEVVSPWLRNGLNPVLHRAGAGLVLVHHVNKPATGEQKSEWKAGDFAYIGSGSADLANWARAVVAIRSLGDHHVFELRLGKRGKRAGWTEPDGTPSYARRIAHGTEGIVWREADAHEGPGPAGRKAGATPEQLAALLDGKELSTTDWRALAGDELGVSRTAFYRIKTEAEGRKLVIRSKLSDRWLKA